MNETQTDRKFQGEEAIGRLFGPQTVLPGQFFAKVTGRGPVEGEVRLLAAVLQDAIETYLKHRPRPGERLAPEYEEAHHWIFEGADDWFFSFENACHILNLDPEFVRRGLEVAATERPRLRRKLTRS